MPDAARERSRWLDIERALGSYEAVLDDQEVDAVYVASTPQGG
jgi:predicted dehydrogenase